MVLDKDIGGGFKYIVNKHDFFVYCYPKLNDSRKTTAWGFCGDGLHIVAFCCLKVVGIPS